MNTPRPSFSANIGFLWKELPFLERLARAHAAGFEGIEYHDDAQNQNPAELSEAVERFPLPVQSLNTRMGDSFGCAAVAGCKRQAREDIAKAAEAAELVDAKAIHVLAGKADSRSAEARQLFRDALLYALDRTDRTVLIEPLSRLKAEGYFLYDIVQAGDIVADLAEPRLQIMFDCYHVQQERGDVVEHYAANAGAIGHIQIASHPERAEPDSGALDYGELLPRFMELGYAGMFGCEYTPKATVEEGLGWRDQFR